MFNKLWNRITNSKGLYTQEQINEVKEQIAAVDKKIESMKQVIEVYMTSEPINEKRILANQNSILEREIEKAKLLVKLAEMEAKSVN
tara:strand:- start:461 stop:721 length:261 start_codon:yes stop_codon:yes gene_type:complete